MSSCSEAGQTGTSANNPNHPNSPAAGPKYSTATEVGHTTSVSVNKTGGVALSAGAGATVVVPAGALTTPTVITIAVSDASTFPDQNQLLSHVYDVGPSGTKFLSNLDISIVTIRTVPTGMRPTLAYLNDQQAWQVLPTHSFDVTQKIAHALVNHFTQFAVLAVPVDGSGCVQAPDPNAFCAPNACDANSNACTGSAAASQYAVGGYLNGIATSAVTLTNNGFDTLTLQTNGSFKFPTTLTNGSAYLVAISQQPNNAVCSVVGGNGTIAAKSVTGITVTCLPTVGIGGTVAGLNDGGRITLQNGMDQVVVDANTPSFSLPRVLSGQNFNVTVALPPTGQQCSITGGQGRANQADATVRVACRNATFTLGGTVTGLLANTNVILRNGTDALSGANGNYTFKTSVSYSQNYNVSIASPVGQLCTFGAGVTSSASMPASNVATINVACTPLTYTLGGSISGLAANTLVTLQDNNDTLSLGNGNYTFPTPVAYASQVALVTTPPAGQTCRFSDTNTYRNFPMGAANLQNVTLTCTANKYSIGGSVTGLLGGQLVVLTNNSNTITSTNGNYMFPVSLPSGGNYNVSLISPAGHSCAITGTPNGVVGSANVTTVAVACSPLTYALGGLISGVSGNGNVVLTSGNDIVAFSNGSYAFPTPIAYNSSYSVSLAPAAGDNCNFSPINSNIGVMGAQNVTDVNVTCYPSVVTYSIGGIVSGLSANTTITLQNGNDTIATGNGGYVFPTSVLRGGSFSVSFTDPPGQSCGFTGGHAGVANANVVGVYIACSQLTYTLGGTVSGLVTGTHVLITSANDIYSAGNGAYTFQTHRIYNTHFTVSFTSPANQTCQFSPANSNVGVIGAGNVNNVAVVCTPFTYNLGGLVSGLPSNTTVTLAWGNDTIPQGNGAYTFPTPVGYGTNYNITITSPGGESCAFSPTTAGNATMPAANVSNANVVCTTITYAVGGTISGLAGTIRLTNGNDALSTGANGTYHMPVSLANQAPYDIVVNTQPNNQLCSVSQGSGTVNAANVTTAMVNCTSSYALSVDVANLATGGNITLSNGADVLTLPVTSPNATFPTRILTGSNYNVVITTAPVGQTCAVAFASAAMPAHDLTLAVQCNITLKFSTGQSAAVVIGQADFVSTVSTGDSVHLNAPLGSVFYAPTGDLYVGDQEHYRIVGYHNGVPSTNGHAFDFVVGQPDFTTTTSWSTPDAANYMPRTLVGNQNYLVEVDGYDSRVLIIHSFPEATVNANVVVGQSGFTSNATACTQAGLNAPRGASVTASNHLLVADTANNRVLIWTSMPIANGQSATLVLGQPNFTTCTQPNNNASTAGTLSQPYDVWSDGTHVLVADTFAARVLVWNSFPTANGQNADAVVGQSNFSSSNPGTGSTSIGGPAGVTSDGNSIFVSEVTYSRASQWSGVPWKGQTPGLTAVIGEVDTSTATCNLGNSSPGSNTVCQPSGITIVGTQLIVADVGNNRLLVYQSQ